jgi:hypothetical protein
MRRVAPWVKLAVAGLVGAATSATALVIFLAPSLAFDDRPPSPLVSGLSDEWSAADAEFARRLRSRFPIGSSEAAMTEELRRQGFIRQDWTSGATMEREAMRQESSFPCRVRARVYWRATQHGQLTAIRGRYGEEGCL